MKGSRLDKLMLCIIVFFIVLASGCASMHVQSSPVPIRPTLEALQHHQHRGRSIGIQFTRNF